MGARLRVVIRSLLPWPVRRRCRFGRRCTLARRVDLAHHNTPRLVLISPAPAHRRLLLLHPSSTTPATTLDSRPSFSHLQHNKLTQFYHPLPKSAKMTGGKSGGK